MKKQWLIILSVLFFSNVTFGNEAYPSFTFYASGNTAYLYDMDKKEIHQWKSQYRAASNAYLLPDSSVLFPGRNPGQWSGGAQQGGRLQVIKWNGELAWDFQYSSATYCPHHDIEPIYVKGNYGGLPNVLVICYEKIGSVTSDKIVEIKPTGKNTGEIVWEWHAWDHRTTNPKDNPRLLDENAAYRRAEWTHINNVSYNPELDQIILGVKHFGEVMVIDHSTTTSEAKGNTGGKYGMGGNILYRWGNPSNYGVLGTQFLNAFHCARWVPKVFPGTSDSVPGGGNIILVNNTKVKADEFKPVGKGDGVYPRESGKAFGPEKITWDYSGVTYSAHQGSVQRLPNGNTFMCDTRGKLLEVTVDGKEVWSLNARANKASKYALTYLDGNVSIGKKITVSKNITFFIQQIGEKVHFSVKTTVKRVSIFSLQGKLLYSFNPNKKSFSISKNQFSRGSVIVTFTTIDKLTSQQIVSF